MAQPDFVSSKGDSDLAAIGALLADPGRCRMLLALDDGRALPASRLAAEAGVSPATASSHLTRLVNGGLLSVERGGRYRYYRLAGAHVGALLEAVGAVAPTQPVRSLREHGRARALREARTCYDHLAGRLGVDVMGAMLSAGHLTGGDGDHHVEWSHRDRPVGAGRDLDYRLTPAGQRFVTDWGVHLPPRRRAVGYCIDWTEQRHHLSGGLGRGLLDRSLELGWIRRRPGHRAVQLTDAGRSGFHDLFGIDSRPEQ